MAKPTFAAYSFRLFFCSDWSRSFSRLFSRGFFGASAFTVTSGTVAGIQDRAREASATMLANVNPTVSWVRLAQRVPVRIAIDDVPEDFVLISGRTATVRVSHVSPPARPKPGDVSNKALR